MRCHRGASAIVFSGVGLPEQVTAALALDDRAVSLQAFAASAPERTAIIMGTEGDGLRPATRARCTSTVMIPMSHGVDSLNVAAATAVACYALQAPHPAQETTHD